MDNLENLALQLSGYKGEKIDFLRNEPMKYHTSFKIGGAASFFVTPRSEEALAFVYSAAANSGLRTFILGKGTNVLFDDAGYDGVVISTLALDSYSENANVLTFGAGCSFTAASRRALEKSLASLTFAYGIPGSVGGAVFMNAGAYNGEVSNVLWESKYFDLNDGAVHTLSAAEHEFSYRHSSYMDHPERVIVSASFSLKSGVKEDIEAEMDDFMNRRRTKQPLEYPSAGSTFKRCCGRFSGQMIEELGLKGASVGGAAVSEKHAGFIINKGGASSADVLALIAQIRKKIKEAYGLDIECEVIYVK